MLKFLPVILILGWANFSSAGENVHVYVHNEPSYSGIRFYETPVIEEKVDPCFPYGCNGGITGPFTNRDPAARKPENLTACSYDANGKLFYHRPGKVCLPEWRD
jgi:hypothetical protein